MRLIRKPLWWLLDLIIMSTLLGLGALFTLDPRSGWGMLTVLLGLWLWLRINRARYGNHRLLVGVALLLLSLITLGRAAFLPEPHYADTTPNQVRFGDYGNGFLSPFSYEFTEASLSNGLVFHRAEDEPIEIEATVLDNLVTIEGEWLLTGGKVVASGGMDEIIFLPVAQPTWDTDPLSQQTEVIAPSVTFDLPLTDDQVHHEVLLKISADLAFPSPKTQSTVTQTVERELILYVGSASEFMDRLRANRYDALQNFMEDGGEVSVWVIGILGLALTVWGGVVVQNHMIPPHSPAKLARSQMRLKTMKEANIRVYDTPPAEGAFVEAVEPDSAFDRAGVQPQDVIIRVGSDLTQNPNEVYRALRSVDLAYVPLNVWRQGEVLNLVIQFGGRTVQWKQKTTSS